MKGNTDSAQQHQKDLPGPFTKQIINKVNIFVLWQMKRTEAMKWWRIDTQKL
jgi:hypothetical protein